MIPSDSHDDLGYLIAGILDVEVVNLLPQGGGSVSLVYQVSLADGDVIIAKVDYSGSSQLELEGYMLRYLADKSNLPVPEVLHVDERLLLLENLPGSSRFSSMTQVHAAELLTELHSVAAPQYGFERSTLIGGLHQPNPWSDNWLEFFRDNRLLYMGQEAMRYGRLPKEIFHRLTNFCLYLDRWIEPPEYPSLIHGDAWTGNILADSGRITGFIDPAIYYAHPEIELAFTTLFGTFGEPFFSRYNEIRPIPPGFMEVRKDIYNLYPLLVHVRLFGGGYVQSVERILTRFGY